MRCPILHVPASTVAASALALLIAACDGDKTPNQTGRRGTGGHGRHGGHRRRRGMAGTGGRSAGVAARAARDRRRVHGTAAARAARRGRRRRRAPARPARRSSTPTSCWRASTPTERSTPPSARSGVARVDLGTGALVGTAGRDAPWGIAKDGAGSAAHLRRPQEHRAGRVDADRVVARMTPGRRAGHDVR